MKIFIGYKTKKKQFKMHLYISTSYCDNGYACLTTLFTEKNIKPRNQ